jgi:hypothetical protein
MTLREAKLILGEEEDAYDQYELLLFEHKNYFLNKLPVLKIFKPRFSKMQNEKNALEVLLGKFDTESPSFVQNNYSFSENILETYNYYTQEKNKLRLAIMHAETSEAIQFFAFQLCDLEKKYAACWNLEKLEEQTLISKEPDPMAVFEAIKSYQKTGGMTFEDLRKMRNEPPVELWKEANRLSHLVTKY